MTEMTSPTDELVRLEKDGHVAVVTLNRPEVRNAINHALALALGQALEEVANDPQIRSAVLRGEGRAFCAGQDLSALAAGESVGLPEHPEWGFGGMVRHLVDKPIVAAVQGFAFGGGLELALTCDLIVLGASASIGFPEVRLGLFAAAGGIPRIAQHMPPKIAAQYALTGAPMASDTALRWGIVNEVAPDDEVFARALEMAGAIALNGPRGVQATKRILRDLGSESTWAESTWSAIQRELDGVFASEEADEGIRAFLERRAPRWAD
jgi:crotonobetainyl-CoA hydratase